jgi:hypothetical protein
MPRTAAIRKSTADSLADPFAGRIRPCSAPMRPIIAQLLDVTRIAAILVSTAALGAALALLVSGALVSIRRTDEARRLAARQLVAGGILLFGVAVTLFLVRR